MSKSVDYNELFSKLQKDCNAENCCNAFAYITLEELIELNYLLDRLLIFRENIETDGALNPNSRLDFMLTGQIVTCERTQQTVDAVLTTVTVTKNKLAVSIKFTDVKTGQIVLSEVMTKEENGQNVTFDKLANELATELIAKVVTKLYPPMVLSVKNPGNIIQTVNADYELGDVLEIYKNGEELLDPYTGDVIGYEEETVAFVIVFEVNSKTNLVN